MSFYCYGEVVTVDCSADPDRFAGSTLEAARAACDRKCSAEVAGAVLHDIVGLGNAGDRASMRVDRNGGRHCFGVDRKSGGHGRVVRTDSMAMLDKGSAFFADELEVGVLHEIHSLCLHAYGASDGTRGARRKAG